MSGESATWVSERPEEPVVVLSAEQAADILVGSFPYSQGESITQFVILEWVALTHPNLRVDTNQMRGVPYEYGRADSDDPFELLVMRVERFCQKHLGATAIVRPTEATERVVYERHIRQYELRTKPGTMMPLAPTVPGIVREAAEKMVRIFDFREQFARDIEILVMSECDVSDLLPNGPRSREVLLGLIINGAESGVFDFQRGNRGLLDADIQYLESEEGRHRHVAGRAQPHIFAGTRAGLDPRTDPWASHVIDYGYLAKPTMHPVYDAFFADVVSYLEEQRANDTELWRTELGPKLARVIEKYNERHPDAQFALPLINRVQAATVGGTATRFAI